MRAFELLVFFTHLPLGKSSPALPEVLSFSKVTDSVPARLAEVHLNPATTSDVPHASPLTTNNQLPEINSAQPAKLEKEVTLDPPPTSLDSGEARSTPLSSFSDTSLVEPFRESNNIRSSTIATKNLQSQQNAIAIYQRLTDKLSETIVHFSDGWNVLPKLRTLAPNLKQQIKNSGLLISNTWHSPFESAAWLKTYFTEDKPAELILTSPEIDQLEAKLAGNPPSHPRIKIRNEIVNTYYQLLSGPNKKSSLFVEIDPDQYKLVDNWRKDNFVAYQYLESFMSDVLSPSEFLRRSQIIEAQADQFRIYHGWDAAVKRISAETGYSPKVVSAFGQKLGGKEIFPSFNSYGTKNHEYKAQLAELKDYRRDNPELGLPWKHYLKSSYDARITLLETLAELKHPDVIPSETISAWLAQNLDVNRMLKIVDYSEEAIKNTPKDQNFVLSKLENPEEYEQVKNLLKSSNSIRDWTKSVEHRQLLQLPRPTRSNYRQVYTAVSNSGAKPRVEEDSATSPKKESPTVEEVTATSPKHKDPADEEVTANSPKHKDPADEEVTVTGLEHEKPTVEEVEASSPEHPEPTKKRLNWWQNLIERTKGFLSNFFKALTMHQPTSHA